MPKAKSASTRATAAKRNAPPPIAPRSAHQDDAPQPSKQSRPAPVRRNKKAQNFVAPVSVATPPTSSDNAQAGASAPTNTNTASAPAVPAGEWVPAPLRAAAIPPFDSPQITLHSAMQTVPSQARPTGGSDRAHDIDKDAQIA
ncbi:hypothetical protein QFC24_005396 [Naganishia onofrii]|uniref:Uncharacterized protein n=1 Tax=Naganishia onofrii TaxID=1851511 RepID=A0ACC2X8I5_9TREE|nr:hypothetical protein QFC24_005396 [Naganishia onofrii]